MSPIPKFSKENSWIKIFEFKFFNSLTNSFQDSIPLGPLNLKPIPSHPGWGIGLPANFVDGTIPTFIISEFFSYLFS